MEWKAVQAHYRRLFYAAKRRGLTQVKLAKRAGLAQPDVSRLLTMEGVDGPHAQTLLKAIEGLGLSVSTFFAEIEAQQKSGLHPHRITRIPERNRRMRPRLRRFISVQQSTSPWGQKLPTELPATSQDSGRSVSVYCSRRKDHHMKSRLLVGLALMLAVACGSDPAPTAPSPPPPASVAGNWSGTLQGTQPQTGAFITALVMNLTQAGATVNGTWSVASANGTVTGTTTTTSFSGTFTWNATTNAGAPCTGTWAVSGNAGGTTMTWTSPGVTANCVNLPTSLTLAVQSR